MNDDFDPLERELAALRPQAVSPELRQAVAGRLAGKPARHRPRLQRVLLAGAAVAACVAVALGVWLSTRRLDDESKPIAMPAPPHPRKQTPPETWRDYQQALIGSEVLDGAFHAAAAAKHQNQKPLAAFGRADHAILLLEGDLR